MKAILYTGAALMIGASIYGFVDYKQTSRKKEFKTMYKEPVTAAVEEPKTVTAPVVTTVAKAEPVSAAENKEIKKSTAAVKKKNVKKKRTFSTKLFSRGALDERYIKPVPPEDIKTDTKKTTDKEE
jgi:hypothetical protein